MSILTQPPKKLPRVSSAALAVARDGMAIAPRGTADMGVSGGNVVNGTPCTVPAKRNWGNVTVRCPAWSASASRGRYT